MFTAGITTLDQSIQYRILRELKLFDDFTDDNDPYGEHDCAIVSWEEYRVVFKIDYYDPALQCHSEDPANPENRPRNDGHVSGGVLKPHPLCRVPPFLQCRR